MEFDRLAVPNLTKQLRDLDRKKQLNPDAPDLKALGLPKVWVVYRWSPKPKTWMLVGFVRYPHLSKRRIDRIRRKFDINPSTTITVMDLFDAQRIGGPQAPPVQAKFEKPFTMPALKLEKEKGRTVRRARQPDAEQVRFIVVGDKRMIDKCEGPVYLGTLFAKTLAAAKREAKRLFNMYSKLFVYDLKQLGKYGKRLKRRIVKGRLLPGVTTLVVKTA